jgi:PAS domain S-box-containing protein
MPLGVVCQDANGYITSANPAAERLLGVSLEQMRGRTSSDHRWRAIRDDGSDMLAEEHPSMITLQTGHPTHNVIMGVFDPSAQETRWLSVSSYPVFDGAVKPAVVYATFEDITEQRAATFAFESISDAFVVLDREWRFSYINVVASRMLARNREELLGRCIWDEFPTTVGTISDIEYHRAVDHQVSVSFEQHYPPLSAWFEVRAHPFRGGLSVFFQDITQQKAADIFVQDVEMREKSLLRDVLSSVTGGKLRLVEADRELPKSLKIVRPPIDLTLSYGLSDLRHRVKEAATSLGFPDNRWQGLVIGASEVGMNAIVHGGGRGTAIVSTDGVGLVQVRVSDWGKGIKTEHLPKAALSRGWSSTTSLGCGLVMTLETIDRLYLQTGPGGTTAVMEQECEEPGPSWF